jgi:hypothetical protein
VRIILRRSVKLDRKRLTVGTVMVVTNEKFKEFGDSVEEYKGEFPPKKKHKLNLSQLKTQ